MPNTLLVDCVRALLEQQRSRPAQVVAPVVTLPVRSRRKWPLVAAGVALAVGASLAFWARRNPPPPAPVTNAAPAGEKSIAVLPFTNMSDDKENAYFADGVHEDVLTNLANISVLKVISRTSVMQYRDTKKTLRQIGTELGVAYILEGSVRHSGNRIRVTGQLINARTDEHVWAKAYDRELTDVFAVQEELSREITIVLQTVLSPQDNARLEHRPTQNVAAYQLYQRALALIYRGVARASVDQALPLLEQAVALDPNYAKAWAAISVVEGLAYGLEDKSPSRLSKMREAQAQAEKADPNDYDVLTTGANLAGMVGDRALADRYHQRIIELFPNRVEAFLTLALMAARELRWAEALAAFAQGRLRDPFNVDLLASYESVLLSLRHFAEAEEIERILIRLNPEDSDAFLRLATTAFFRSGSTQELKGLLARLPPEDRDKQDPFVRYTRFEVMVMLGDADGLIRIWRQSEGDFRFRDYSEREGRMLVAAAYLAKKDPVSARPLLEKNRDSAQAALLGNPADPTLLNDLGVALGMLGEPAAGRAKLAQARAILNSLPANRKLAARFYSAVDRAWVGEKAEAVAALADMLRSTTMAGLQMNVYEIRSSLLMVPLRGDPAFEAMLNDPANNAPLF